MANVPVAGIVVGVLAAVSWAACACLSYWFSRSKSRVAPAKAVIGKNTEGGVVFVGTAPPTKHRQDRLDPTALTGSQRGSLSVVPVHAGRQGPRQGEARPLNSRQSQHNHTTQHQQRGGDNHSTQARSLGEHRPEAQPRLQLDLAGIDGNSSS